MDELLELWNKLTDDEKLLVLIKISMPLDTVRGKEKGKNNRTPMVGVRKL